MFIQKSIKKEFGGKQFYKIVFPRKNIKLGISIIYFMQMQIPRSSDIIKIYIPNNRENYSDKEKE